MTARGAVGRQKEQGRSAVRIKEDENDGGGVSSTPKAGGAAVMTGVTRMAGCGGDDWVRRE